MSATTIAPNEEDAELVSSYLAGESRAFTTLYDRYQRRLINFIFKAIGDSDRAEDIVQETFLRVHRHIKNFDQTKKFSTWIYTIASNLAKNELRDRSRSPLVFPESNSGDDGEEERVIEYPDKRLIPDTLLHQKELREVVELAMADLSLDHREVFFMREFDGRHYEEIAILTGTELGTVKSRLNRARVAFAEIIGPWLDDYGRSP